MLVTLKFSLLTSGLGPLVLQRNVPTEVQWVTFAGAKLSYATDGFLTTHSEWILRMCVTVTGSYLTWVGGGVVLKRWLSGKMLLESTGPFALQSWCFLLSNNIWRICRDDCWYWLLVWLWWFDCLPLFKPFQLCQSVHPRWENTKLVFLSWLSTKSYLNIHREPKRLILVLYFDSSRLLFDLEIT